MKKRLRHQLTILKLIRMNERENRIPKQVVVIPIIEPKRKLLEIDRQMLDGELVIRSVDGPLEKAPHVLYVVGMNVSNHPFVLSVVYGLVHRVVVGNALVRVVFVSENHFGVIVYVFVNERVHRLFGSVFDNSESDITTTLNRADHDSLVAFVAHAASSDLTADEGFINFDRAVEQRRSFLRLAHCSTDTVSEKPCGFVRNTKHALQLVRADPLLGLRNHVDGQEPFPEREFAIVENASHSDGELIAA